MTATALKLFILAHLTIWHGRETVYARHLRAHPTGAEQRAEEQAEDLVWAADMWRLDRAIFAALAILESGLNADAESPCGALGLMQLHPQSRWGKAWLRECRVNPAHCETRNVYWGAIALRDGLDECGSYGLALGFYRSGRCIEGPRALEVLELAERIREWGDR